MKKQTTKWVLIIMIFALSLLGAQLVSAADAQVSLNVDGEILKLSVPPLVKDGRTLLPIRAMSESQGAQVAWDPATRTVFITLDGHVIKLTLDSKEATIDGTKVQLEVPASSVKGSTLVPLRFVSEALGAKVEFDNKTKTARVVSAAKLVEIADVTGNVEVFEKGSWRPVKNEELIEQGASIRTDNAGGVTLLTSDGSAMKLEANSETQITKLEKDKATGDRKIEFDMVKGAAITQVVNQQDGSEFKLKSHGTEFLAPDSTFRVMSDGKTAELAVLSGTVVMQNPKLLIPIAAPANTYVSGIQTNEIPKDPVFIPDEKLQDFNMQKTWMKQQIERVQSDLSLKQNNLLNFASEVPKDQIEAQKAIISQLSHLQDFGASQQEQIRQMKPRVDLNLPADFNDKALQTQGAINQFIQNKPDQFTELSEDVKKQFSIQQALFVNHLIQNAKINTGDNSEFIQQAEKLQGNVIGNHDFQFNEAKKNGNQNKQNVTFKFIELPAGTVLPNGFVLPQGIQLNENSKLPEGVVLPPGTTIPDNFKLPTGASLPPDVKFSDHFQLPPNVILQPGFEFKKPIDLPPGTQLPIGFQLQKGVELPKDVKLPPAFQVPEGTKLPDNVNLPTGVNLPPGIEIPKGAVIADGVSLPKDVKLGAGITYGQYVQFQDNKQPDANNLPKDMIIKDGILVPKDFNGTIEKDEKGNVKIIDKNGNTKSVKDIGLPPAPDGVNKQFDPNKPPVGQDGKPVNCPDPNKCQQPDPKNCPDQSKCQQPDPKNCPDPSKCQSGGQQPPMGGQQPPMGGQQPPMGGQQPPMGGQQPPMGGQQPPMGGQQPPIGGQQPPIGGQLPPPIQTK